MEARTVMQGLSEAAGLCVVHADGHLLVLDKPAGLLSVPGRGADKADCLSARVQAHDPQALVVHRLDMATSGLIMMALGADMQRKLSQAFAAREVSKRYEAVVFGMLEPTAAPGEWDVIDLPIAADWPNRPLRVIDSERGQPSLTRWRVLGHDRAANTTRVALEPVTGRSHQLRVHLKALGHPIVGDALYAPPAIAAASPRLLLHACALRLVHPQTGASMEFSSPAPF